MVQIGCPSHLPLSLFLVSLSFMLFNIPLLPPFVFPVGFLLWILFPLPVVYWETWSFLFLPSPSMAPVPVCLGYWPNAGSRRSRDQSSTYQNLLLIWPEQPFQQTFSWNPLWHRDRASDLSPEQGQSLLDVLLHLDPPCSTKTWFFRRWWGKFGWVFLWLKSTCNAYAFRLSFPSKLHFPVSDLAMWGFSWTWWSERAFPT